MSSLTITIIQADLHWENKKVNRQMLEEKIYRVSEKTEIVVLPEMFTTGFSMKPELFAETMEGETVSWMKKIAAEKKIIITGSVNIKVLPLSTVLSTLMVPPFFSTKSLHNINPSPVPDSPAVPLQRKCWS